uniref:N-acetyltransferase domain-containing protein n=1 Tax=Gossypium raimondii TaxID=29730 RepID=A0A0D2RYH1_GOSRA|nr:hypothetical protein B456_006G233400 [Gossypium raimondii]
MDPSRISLRRFHLPDVDGFLKWASDDKVTRYLRWNTITSREEALSYLQKVAIPQTYRRSICLDDRSIGYVSIKPGSGKQSSPWMAVANAFTEFQGLVRVEALVEVENIGSQRVLEKVGFLKEGLLRKYGFCKGEIRDMIVYSFLSTDMIK